jgi:tricorn protease
MLSPPAPRKEMLMLRQTTLILFALSTAAPAQGTRLLRRPSLRGNVIAFAYAGDLWTTSRTGGAAHRVTSTPEVEGDPQLSPDGSLIAYTHTLSGNTDVFVVPTVGGEPRRLTWHPGTDQARGWTPDGKRVLFASDRTGVPQSSYMQLWSVSADGGPEEMLPLPRGFAGSYSPDGKRLAYEEISTVFIPGWYEGSFWKHYRGGRVQPIRVTDLGTHSVEKLPWTDSNDRNAMWSGNTIYFISDRTQTANVFAYDVGSRQLRQLTKYSDSDVMNAAADGDAVVYEQAGYVHLLDTKTGQDKQLAINVTGDFAWARPQFKKVAPLIRDAELSATGVRVAIEARGEIFTVPTEKGDWRNLTRSSTSNDHSPSWSPDGSQVAWFSDAGGTHQLMVGDQTGLAKPRAIALPGNGAAYFSELHWSPNGKQLVAEDNHQNLWLIDPATARAVKIETEPYEVPSRNFEAIWSPDSRWIAYSRSLENHLRGVFMYSMADGKSVQVTDPLADAATPAFDATGKYLYFMASTDLGARTSWLEMTQVDRTVRRSIYFAILNPAEASPLLPELGDEAEAAARPAKPDSVATVNLTNISQRILSLGVPAGDYSSLQGGPAGTIYYLDPMPGGPAAGARLMRVSLKERTPAPVLEGVRSFSLSADRKKLLYQASGARWGVVATDKPARVGDGLLNVAALETWVDPRAEWAEIFREAWRNQREYFYDEKLHGANWSAVYDKYSAMLPSVNHRNDLSYLMAQVGGELTVGHSYLTGKGDEPDEAPLNVGLLGADYSIENGRYRIKHIITGENWNPELRAPLAAPGIRVNEGDYLLEVNGRPVSSATNIYSLFEQTANRQTVLRVSATPAAEGSRLVTVVPVASEDGLRTRAWVEGNRRKVDELSGGKIAYIWLPNTTTPGYASFIRYYFAQEDRDGVVIDERYNHGGMVADYIVNELERKQMGYFAMRNGKPWTSPAAGIWGPKVMIINESAGSGGDALPFMFHQRQIGPMVGTRTWGGLVGTLGVPATIDGGGMTAPSLAFYTNEGHWAIENEGVKPDITVENLPVEMLAGHDAQLERAVREAMQLLEASPVRRTNRPSPIDRTHP